MIDLKQVLTFTEAAEKWKLAGGNTLRQAVARGRFQESEIRKSGTVWLTTYEAMTRVFGPLPDQEQQFKEFEQSLLYKLLMEEGRASKAFQEIEKEAAAALVDGKQLQVRETLFGKEIILFQFATLEEWERWLSLTERSLIPRKSNQKA